MEYSTPLDPIADEPEAIVIVSRLRWALRLLASGDVDMPASSLVQRPLTVYYEKSPDTDSILSIELDKPVVKDWCTEEPKVPARPTTGIFAVRLGVQCFAEARVSSTGCRPR